MEVYNALGPGFREESYRQALTRELTAREITFDTERSIPVFYCGSQVDTYRLDLIVEDLIIAELKAVAELHPRFEAQLLSYLRAANLELGYLVNFGSDQLVMRRILNSRFMAH